MEPRRCPKCGLPSYGESVCSNCMAPLTGSEPVVQTNRLAPVVAPSSRFVSVMAGILVLGLAIYWLGQGGLLLRDIFDERPDVLSGARVYGMAIGSLVLGLYSLFVSILMFRRSYRARGELILASVFGVALGIVVPILLENWYQFAVVGAYAVMILFALFGARFFDFGD